MQQPRGNLCGDGESIYQNEANVKRLDIFLPQTP